MPSRFVVDWRIVAPCLVLCAGVCWGLIGLFSQVLAAQGLSSVQITVVRCTIVTVLLFCWLILRSPRAFRIRLRDIWMFVGTGIVSIAFFNVCYFACIQEANLSLAVILLYTAPCFVVLLSALLFKERMTRKKITALLIAFVGCLLVVGLGSQTAHISLFGILVGLGSGIGYALYSIFARFALARYSPVVVMFYTFLLASVALVPISSAQDIVMVGLSSYPVLLVMLGLAVISTLLPFVCYTVGLQHMETGKASIMAFVEPMVALLIGVGVFHDVLTVLNGVGIILILLAVTLLNMPQKFGPTER